MGKIQKLYQRGIITEGERYNQVLDAWTHAREQITSEMMESLENDHRVATHVNYVNPIFLMAHSGARGGVEQIRQLAGMRGLMAKPSGKIIETPIKANFREGLSVLEYFSSTHGARKGLADTALKTADSGYLTRKLADVAQNVVVTQHDCGTTQGITKGVIYRGEKVEVSLKDSIRGRVSRANIVNPITDEVVVKENDLITRRGRPPHRGDGPGEDPGPQPDDLRRRAGHLRPVLRHGPLHRLAGGGRHGRGHHRRPEHRRAGHAVDDADVPHRRHGRPPRRRERDQGQEARRGQVHPHEGRPQRRRAAGRAHPQRRDPRPGPQGPRTGEIRSARRRQPGRQPRTRKSSRANLAVAENQEVMPGALLCQWDPHAIPILAEVSGKVRFEDIIEGETMRLEKDPSGHERQLIMEHKGDLHPQIILEDETGKILDFYYLPEKAHIEVTEGNRSRPARCWPRRPAKWPARRTSPAVCPA